MAGKNDRNIKTILSLTGKDDYVKGLGQISAELRENKSAMALLDEQYKDNTDSLEYMAQREELLNQRLDLNNAKVAAMEKTLDSKRQAEEKAAQVVDENTRLLDEKKNALAKLEQAEDKNAAAIAEARKEVEYQSKVLENSEKKYDSAAAAVANMQNRMNGAEKEVAQTTNAMRASGDAASGLGGTINELAGKLGVSLPAGLTKSLDGLKGLDAAALAAGGVVVALAMAIYKVIEALAKMTIGQSKAADEIATLSQQSSISIQTLQELTYAEELLDVDTGTLTKSLVKLTRSMDDARSGNAEYAEAFKRLGVNIKGMHGEMRSTEDVMWDALDALAEVGSQADRDAIAMQLFGRSATDLNPLILAGRDTLAGYTAEAHKLGYVLGTEDMAALTSLDDANQRLAKTWEACQKQIAVKLAPSLEKIVTILAEALPQAVDLFVESGLLDILIQDVELGAQILQLLNPIMTLLNPLIQLLTGPLSTALAVVTDALTLIVSTISGVVNAFKALFELINTGKISSATQAALDTASAGYARVFSAKGATAQAYTKWQGSIPGYAGGTSYHPGGLAKVGERGWEYAILPRGTQVIPHAQSVTMAARGVPGYANGTGGGDTIVNITLQGAEIEQIKRIIDYFGNYSTSRRKG